MFNRRNDGDKARKNTIHPVRAGYPREKRVANANAFRRRADTIRRGGTRVNIMMNWGAVRPVVAGLRVTLFPRLSVSPAER
jgi:hypothetical protein